MIAGAKGARRRSISLGPVGGPDNVAWAPIFEDTFSGSSLDTSKWVAEEGRLLNNMSSRSSNVSVTNGELLLVLSDESGTIRGAHASTDPEDGAGINGYAMEIGDYVEARCYFPSAAGVFANWSAFWISGQDWPSNGETDIVEGLGGDPTINYHYGPITVPSSDIASNSDWTGASPLDSWHVFGAYRRPNYVDVYWDGVLARQIKSNDLGGPQGVLATVGKRGSSSATPVLGAPGGLRIDYVRAWRAPITDPVLPNWPFSFTAVAVDNDSVDITWSAATSPQGAGPVTAYRIYDGAIGGSYSALIAEITAPSSPNAPPWPMPTFTATINGLTPGTPYVLGIKAVNAQGESIRTSPTVSLTMPFSASPLPAGTIARGSHIPSVEVLSGTTAVVPRPDNTANGDLLVASYAGTFNNTPTISGTGWQLRAVKAGAVTVATWTKYITDIASEPTSYTITAHPTTSARISATINRYTGTNQFASMDATAVTAVKAFNAGSSLVLPSITTQTPKAVLHAACGGDFSSSPYIIEPTAMQRTFQSSGTGRRLAVADEYRASAGPTGTRTFTEGLGEILEMDAVMVAIKPAPLALGGSITRKVTVLSESAAATSISCNKPAGLANGDVMIASLVTGGGTPTGPSGWTLVKMQGAGSGTVCSSLWRKVVTDASSEPSSYTWNGSGATNIRMTVGITAYSGVDNTTPIDVTSTGVTVANGAASTGTVSGFSPVTPGAVVISVGGLGAAVSPAIVGPPEMNEVWHSQGTGRQAVYSDEYRAAAGSIGNRVWSDPTVTNLEMQVAVAALRPA